MCPTIGVHFSIITMNDEYFFWWVLMNLYSVCAHLFVTRNLFQDYV